MEGRRQKRCDELSELGLNLDGSSYIFDKGMVYVEVKYLDILNFDDEKWKKAITEIKLAIK